MYTYSYHLRHGVVKDGVDTDAFPFVCLLNPMHTLRQNLMNLTSAPF